MKRIFFISLLLPATWFATAMADSTHGDLPPAFTAVYTVKKAGLTLGDVNISLRYDNQRYRYHKQTHSRGLLALFRKDVIDETSEGKIENGRLTMERYAYRHDNGRTRKENTIQLVSPGRIHERYKNKTYDYRVPPNTLDRASVEIALMRDARHGSEKLTYTIAERGRSKTLEFLRVGQHASMKTPAGNFTCTEYRVNRQSSKRSTTLCVAPELDYLPVTITHVEKGTSFTMRLKTYQPEG